MSRILPVLLFMLCTLCLKGQDLHYSMFFNSPLNLSPGLTGVYNGDQRYHANYRQQWYQWPVGFQSFDIGADYKFRSEDKDNFFGLGALINYDVAGDLDVKYTGFDVFGSYSIKLGSGFLTPGVNIGMGFRGFDSSNALLGEFWNGTVATPGPANDPLYLGNNTDNITFVDLNAGLNYRFQKSFRKHLDLGLSLGNILGASQVFNASANYEADQFRKLNAYGMANWELGSKFDLLLNALGSFQGPYQEIVLNAQGKIYLSDEYTTALYLGAGIRLDDAWYPMIAIQYNKFYAAFSYDIDIKDVNKGGGPEFAVRYIIASPPIAGRRPCPIY